MIYMFVCNIKINNYIFNAEYFHWISCIKVYLVIFVPPVVILSIYIFLGKKLSISISEASLTVYPLKLNIKIAFEDAAFTNQSNLKPFDRVSLPNARYHGHRRWLKFEDLKTNALCLSSIDTLEKPHLKMVMVSV